MKRLLALVCALVMAFAGEHMLPWTRAGEMELVGSGLTARPPEGWLALTRDSEVLARSAAQFDLTEQQARQLLEDNDFYLALYEPQAAAEMYVTAFPSAYAERVGAIGRLDGDGLDAAKAVIAEGYDGWETDSDVAALTCGDWTYLAVTMHVGDGDGRTDNRQLFTVCDGWEVYIDLYAPDGALEEGLVRDQDALAASLRVGTPAVGLRATLLPGTAAWMGAALLGVILIQFIALALSAFLALRQRRAGE